jgi:hypothetical protein
LSLRNEEQARRLENSYLGIGVKDFSHG